GQEGAERGRPHADQAGARAPRRPGARRRRQASSRADRRMGPRPSLVARPDGPHETTTRRADGAHLARLVRDLELGRRLAEADAATEQALTPPLARVVRATAARCHARPRDAA